VRLASVFVSAVPGQFHYIYHIDQSDGGDRILHVDSDNDVCFDEEFYHNLCKTYGAALRSKVFFFVDNRNVIGKDVPFQLIHQRRFGEPLFTRSVILAHDVDDFSRIWQAMGRSRTMNDTRFTIYKSGIDAAMTSAGMQDIKSLPLTRQLYVRNWCVRARRAKLSARWLALLLTIGCCSLLPCTQRHQDGGQLVVHLPDAHLALQPLAGELLLLR
jgi:hypothetical protein